mgnify:CR=1 FL=1
MNQNGNCIGRSIRTASAKTNQSVARVVRHDPVILVGCQVHVAAVLAVGGVYATKRIEKEERWEMK